MADFRDTDLPIEERVNALLGALTIDEKLSLCAGRNFWETKRVPRLGIRAFRMTDGPRGVAFHSARKRGTAFPSGIATGATWDPELTQRMAEAIGRETRDAGCQMILGPAINLCRTPLNGRTFEYFSEDPHLTARLTVPFVEGVQSQGVAACLKHFAANNQETHRMRTSAQVSERALRELYLPAFQAGVEEGGAWSVMAAYNAVNGEAACQHEGLLWDVLRGEWGFEGFVVSDWFAVRRTQDAASCLRAGLSLEMPGRGSRYRHKNLREAHAAGDFSEADVDRSLRGLLRVWFRTGHIDAPAQRRRGTMSRPDHRTLAREVAEASLVLLKNDAGLLPLAPQHLRKIAVVGPKARARNCLPLWGGSSGVWPPHEISPLEGLRRALGDRVECTFGAAGVADADAVVVVVGQSHRPGLDSEVRDRKTMALPGSHTKLIRDTVRANPNTVVVVVAGSPLAMDWAADVPAILMAWYPGMEGGLAIANALLGRVNPSGKLPVTFPRRLADSPAHGSPRTFPGDHRQVHYDEGVFVGYRHFDREAIEPRYAFGHGLSYTHFAYSDLTLERSEWDDEARLGVSFTLRNGGPAAGAEVAQLYVGRRDGTTLRPTKELKGFRKVFLDPGEETRVELQLSPRDLAFFSESARAWLVEAGGWLVQIGSSSRDIRLEKEFQTLKDRRLAEDMPLRVL